MVNHLYGTRQPGRWAVQSARVVAGLDLFALAAFGLPLLIYTLTLAPTIYNLDSAELTTAVATNGIVRATGYPLYLVLGKIWSWLPIGDMGYRMNLFSAVCGAATILLLDRILRRLKVNPWLRLAALGLLATAPYFWALSLIAEVYTLHTVLMAGIILLLLRWAEVPSAGHLAAPIFLSVLSMGNHSATVLLLPGLVFYVLATHPRELLKWRVWFVGLLAAIAGAAIFLTLPLRYAAAPAFNYAGQFNASGAFVPVDLLSFEGFWWLVTGKSFAGQMFGYRLHELLPQAHDFGLQLWNAFIAIGLGPGVVGLLVLMRRDWRFGGMLLLMFLANAVFYINYRVIDKATMFLPAYLIWAIWLGVGYQALIRWVTSTRPHPRLRSLLYGVLVIMVLLPLTWNWSRVDLSDDWSTRQQSEGILQQVQPHALILGWWDTVPGLQYLQLVEGQRPDVKIINRFLISSEAMNRLILSELGQRPIYINNPSNELLRVAKVTPVGPLYHLAPNEIPSGDGRKTLN
jgi:hypothetical protein